MVQLNAKSIVRRTFGNVHGNWMFGLVFPLISISFSLFFFSFLLQIAKHGFKVRAKKEREYFRNSISLKFVTEIPSSSLW